MAGMPGWAYALLAPYAADKFIAEPLKGMGETYGQFNEWRNKKADMEQYKRDLARYEADPNFGYNPELTAYNDPAQAFAARDKIKGMYDERMQKASVAPLQDFAVKYDQLAGTGASFYQDPESRAMLEAQGLPQLDTKNPYVAKGLQQYLGASQNTADVTKLAQNPANPDPATLARVSTSDKGDTHLKALLDQFKYGDERNAATNNNALINTIGQLQQLPDWNKLSIDDKTAKVMATVGPGVTIDNVTKALTTAGILNELKLVESGVAGNPEQKIEMGYDARRNKATPIPGLNPRSVKIMSNSVTVKNEGEGAKALLGMLPNSYQGALSANDGLATIKQMKGLIGKGAAGAQSFALATVGPMLNLFGVNPAGLDEAQLYQALAANLKGGLRESVIGPGAVTEYEQKLLDKVTAGGTLAPGAATQLLSYYEKKANARIRAHRSLVTSAESLAPGAGQAWGNLDLGNAPPDPKKY